MGEGEGASQEVEFSYYKPNLKDRIGYAADNLREFGYSAKKRLEKLRYRHRITLLDHDPRLKTYVSPENLNPKADNFNPYYPDLGPLPEIDQNRLERVPTIDLSKILDGSVVGLYSVHDYEDPETKTIKRMWAGHPDSVYTAQIIDSPRNIRYLRIWRSHISFLTTPEDRQKAEQQGLIVPLKEFLNNIINDNNPLVGPNRILYFPEFKEEEGPFGSIALPGQLEMLSHGMTPYEIYYQPPVPKS